MLNFTGQTNRRQVNLGRRPQVSRQKLLDDAKREREKRAQEKLEQSSCVLIQSRIRRYIDLERHKRLMDLDVDDETFIRRASFVLPMNSRVILPKLKGLVIPNCMKLNLSQALVRTLGVDPNTACELYLELGVYLDITKELLSLSDFPGLGKLAATCLSDTVLTRRVFDFPQECETEIPLLTGVYTEEQKHVLIENLVQLNASTQLEFVVSTLEEELPNDSSIYNHLVMDAEFLGSLLAVSSTASKSRMMIPVLLRIHPTEVFTNWPDSPAKMTFTLEYVNYFLMMTRDFELFKIVDKQDFVSFTSHLKDLCYKTGKGVELLSQIYLRDTRLHIFPDTWWTVDSWAKFINSVPFFVPFFTRVNLLQSHIKTDKQRWEFQKLEGTVSRENIFDDAYQVFGSSGESFKKVSITFTSQFGVEAGIDGGGVTKEFLTEVVTEAFNRDYFTTNSEHQYYPNPDCTDYAKLEFIGRVLGKCLYDNILVNVSFAPFFLMKFSSYGGKNSFDDLSTYDRAYYDSLCKLLEMQDVESLGLTFVNERGTELIANGSKIAVTQQNKLQFVHALANYKMNVQISNQTRAFVSGLLTMLDKEWIQVFNPIELQMLISGGTTDIDLEDLKTNVEYSKYWSTDQTIVDLWDVLEHDFTKEERCLFIKFVTSVPRAPLTGFGSLTPKFAIRVGDPDLTRLPTAATCVNLLKLPDYRNRVVLKEKLLYAITSDSGFELS